MPVDQWGVQLAAGHLVGVAGLIPGTAGVIMRDGDIEVFVVTPWPATLAGPTRLAVEIYDRHDRARVYWARPGHIAIEQIEGAGPAGTIGGVQLDLRHLPSGANVPFVQESSPFDRTTVQKLLNDAGGDVRAMLASTAPGLLPPEPLPTPAEDGSATWTSHSRPLLTAVEVPLPLIGPEPSARGWSICQWLRLE